MTDFNEAIQEGAGDRNIVILQPVRAEDVGRRGRPRTKVNPSDVRVTPDKVYPAPQAPGGPAPTKAEEDKADAEKRRKRERRAREVDEIKEKIVTDLNEQILQGLVSFGVPQEFLYKGRPRSAVVSNNYTDIGNALCVTPMHANWMAHGYLELRDVPAIKKWIGQSNPDSVSWFWVGFGALGLLSYLTQLKQAMDMLKDLKTKMQEAMANAQKEPEGFDANPMQFSEA